MIQRDIAAVGDDAVDESDLARLECESAVALIQQLLDGLGMLRDHFVEDVVLVDGNRPQAPTGAAEVLAVGVDADGVPGELPHQRAEARHEGAVDIVGQQDQIRPLLEHSPDLLDRFRRKGHGVRVARVDDEERLDLRVEELGELFIRVLEPVLLRRGDLDEMEVVVLQVRHLEIWGEDRHAQRDRVAGVDDSIALERLEDVAHGGGAALNRVDLELAFGVRVSAHRPFQVLVDDLLIVHQHAVRHRVVVADDRIHQLVHELVGVEAELLHCPRHHRFQERRTRHVAVLLQPGFKPAGDARCLGHATHARGQVEHALALSDGELPEQEERLARLGSDPVGVAATRVQV